MIEIRVFSFKTNHRLLHPFVLAFIFNKKPKNTEHISMIKKKKSRTSLINRRLLPLADAD
jgi:hypothetical protein